MDWGLIWCQTEHLEEAACVCSFVCSHTYVEWMACVLCASGVYVFPGESHVQRGAAPDSPLPDRTEKEQVLLGGKIGPFKL